jgi:hypothetical protein
MFVINNIFDLPVFDPILDPEYIHSAFLYGTDNPIQAAVDDHFFTNKTGKGIYGFSCCKVASEYVHVSTEKADSGSGSIDDSVLFGMHASAQLISLTVRDVKFVSQAESMFCA